MYCFALPWQEVWLLDQCRLIGFGKCWSVSGLRVGGLKEGTIFLGNPAAVKHVLKDNFANYEKGYVFNDVLGEFFGGGIFAVDGARWRWHRKIAANTIS